MKNFLFICCFSFLSIVSNAQDKLSFKGEPVKKVSIIDHSSDTAICILMYDDKNGLSLPHSKLSHSKQSKRYPKIISELQLLLSDISNNRVPMADDLDINQACLRKVFIKMCVKTEFYYLYCDKEERSNIRKKYGTVDGFNSWVKTAYPILDSGTIRINTAHAPMGMNIIIETKCDTYYFVMRDLGNFQPYLMTAKNKDCLASITNFRINRHLMNLCSEIKYARSIPWKNDLLQEYLNYCSEDYIYFY